MPFIRSQHAAGQMARQRGSALLEVALAVSITTLMVMGGLKYWNQQLRSDRARALAGQYKVINAAVGTYMAANWTLLTNTSLAKCGLGSVYAAGAIDFTLASGCGASIVGADGSTYSITHAWQPTIADLQNLHFLPTTTSGIPLLPEDASVLTFSRYTGAVAQPPHTLAVYIKPICTNMVTPDFTSCSPGERDLQSLVFNQRPYLVGQAGELWPQLTEAMLAMENDGVLSMPNAGIAANKVAGVRSSYVLDNPIGPVGAVSSPDGVLAMRNGYGSSGWAKFTRRDGSAKPTADWDFDAKSLRNIQALEAKGSVKIPSKAPDAACNSANESLAISTLDASVLVCKAGTWQRTQGKGVDPQDYRDFAVVDTNPVQVLLDPAEWGMPSILTMKTGATLATDTYCEQTDGVAVGFFINYVHTWCTSRGQGSTTVAAETQWKIWAEPANHRWMIQGMNFSSSPVGQPAMTVRFYRLYK